MKDIQINDSSIMKGYDVRSRSTDTAFISEAATREAAGAACVMSRDENARQ
jgi:hypothetical protein